MGRILIFLLSAAFLLAGCGGPRIIPNKELAAIFHDVFLVNTYVSQTGTNIDSLNIYEPVFAAHGYTIEDIQYTIGNFAKRKSAHLSDDVVVLVSEMLKGESDMWRERRRMHDTVVMVARRQTARTVSFTPRIEVRRTADTARLRTVVEGVRPGSYEVSWSYLVDSLDRNGALSAEVRMEDSAGRGSGALSRTLERTGRHRITLELAAGPEHRRLVVDLNGYGERMTTPRMSVDSLTVLHMLPEAEAVRALSRASWGATDSLRAALGYLPVKDISTQSDEADLGAPAVDTRGAGSR